MSDTQKIVAKYFRAKQKELLSMNKVDAYDDHSGSTNSDYPEWIRAYLSNLLPKRYSIGKGVVYENLGNSGKVDIAIWDSFSYPSLPLDDYSFLFAESTRCAIECKEKWGAKEFLDALQKCEFVRRIVPSREPSLADVIESIQQDIESLKAGEYSTGALISKLRIGTVAMFVNGGTGVTPKTILDVCEHNLDISWPDLVLLLEPGIMARRWYDPETEMGRITFYEYGEDVLMAFSCALLSLLDDRVVHSEARFFMELYAFQYLSHIKPYFELEYSPLYPSPGRRLL